MDSKLNLRDIRAGRVKDLTGADLRWEDLHWDDLHGANLTGANLTGLDLTRVNLNGPELMHVGWFGFCTLPARLLPWLTNHPRFAEWLPTLTVVED